MKIQLNHCCTKEQVINAFNEAARRISSDTHKIVLLQSKERFYIGAYWPIYEESPTYHIFISRENLKSRGLKAMLRGPYWKKEPYPEEVYFGRQTDEEVSWVRIYENHHILQTGPDPNNDHIEGEFLANSEQDLWDRQMPYQELRPLIIEAMKELRLHQGNL